MKNKIKRAFAAVGIAAGTFGVSISIALLIEYGGKLAGLIILALLFAATACLIYQELRDDWND